MSNNAKNDLEATALQEVGKLELIVAEVRKLGATDVAGRSGLSRAGGRSGALRLSGGSGLALRLLSSKELVLTVGTAASPLQPAFIRLSYFSKRIPAALEAIVKGT